MLPSSVDHMTKPNTKSQVKNGLRMAAPILTVLFVGGLFFGGVAYALFPAGHSPGLGWDFIAVSSAIMIHQMSRWIGVLAGLLGLAVLNGLISIASGHVLANPTEPIVRLQAFYLTLFFTACAVLSATLRKRKLNLVDRACVMVFLFSFAWLVASQGTRIGSGKKTTMIDSGDAVAMGV